MKLKPCPFCGAKVADKEMGAGPRKQDRWLFCQKCYACGPVAGTKASAAKKWNRRKN